MSLLLIIMAAGVLNEKVGAECIRPEGLENLYEQNETADVKYLQANCFLGCISPEARPFNVVCMYLCSYGPRTLVLPFWWFLKLEWCENNSLGRNEG